MPTRLRIALHLALVVCLLLLTASACRQPKSSGGVKCGSERWSVKTLSDQDARAVVTAPKHTTVRQLRVLVPPKTLPQAARIAPTELTTFQLKATVQVFKLEDDRDFHVVISEPDNPYETMIVEFPDAAVCSGAVDSSFKDAMQQARDAFVSICGKPNTSFRTCKADVDIIGVGFFDFIHGQNGVAPNGIELHPVLKITKE